MPSLIGTDVAANYRQQIVPFSRFGTRKVAWFKVGHVDTNASGVLDMEKFDQVVSAIQTQAEIVMVGAPYISNNWGKFMIAVFEDTMGDGEGTDAVNGQTESGEVGYNANALSLQDAVRDITGDGNAIVQRFYLFGAPETDTDDYYGWSVDNSYQEYDTKAQYMANSYTQN